MDAQQQIKATFKKNERLKSRSTILSLFTLNKNIRLYPFKLVWLIEPADKTFTPKIGVSVGKRSFKRAVDRNFIKRRMREVFRLNKHLLYEGLQEQNIQLACMFIYTGKDIMSYDAMNKRMEQLLIKSNVQIQQDLNKLE